MKYVTEDAAADQPGVNAALKREVEKVLEQRRWSLAAAQKYTAVNQSTIHKMRHGLDVKPAYIMKFALAVAPRGAEKVVEDRWMQIAVRGETDQPEVDYTWRPPTGARGTTPETAAEARAQEESSPSVAARIVTNQKAVQFLEIIETLPEDVQDSLLAMARSARDVFSQSYSTGPNRKRNSDSELCAA